MKWKLSVGVSSSSCCSLNSPYITALVTVTDPSGAITSKSFEMTIGKFKVSVCKSEKSQMFSCLCLIVENTMCAAPTAILVAVISRTVFLKTVV